MNVVELIIATTAMASMFFAAWSKLESAYVRRRLQLLEDEIESMGTNSSSIWGGLDA